MDGQEGDSDKIRRLMREQAEDQTKSSGRRQGVDDVNEEKREDGTGEGEAKSKGKKKSKKSKDKKTSDEIKKKKGKKSSRIMDETDPTKIERLIREQAEEQARGGGKNRRSLGEIEGGKRERLKRRLRDIDDPKRLRREIRKIRLKELDKDEYQPRESWEDDVDSLPEDGRRDFRRRHYERTNDPEELQHELRVRAFEHDDLNDPDTFHLQELRHQFVEEAEDIRDPKELRKRIRDLDALSAIFARPMRRDRRHRSRRDEL